MVAGDAQDRLIRAFLKTGRFGLLGASNDPEKYGNKIFRFMRGKGYEVIPLNPRETMIEGVPAHAAIEAVPGGVEHLDIVVPAPVAEKIVHQMKVAGVKIAWLQPGAESDALVAKLKEAGIGVIHGGPCIMVSAIALEPELKAAAAVGAN